MESFLVINCGSGVQTEAISPGSLPPMRLREKIAIVPERNDHMIDSVLCRPALIRTRRYTDNGMIGTPGLIHEVVYTLPDMDSTEP